jgi:phenylalanyl-tRNA synthetase beta chain
MKISFEWLKEHVDLGDMTPQQLADLLTSRGLEVESITEVESAD